jgi:hypothetical protein
MTTNELKKVLARVTTWPTAAQDELVKVVREIEEDFYTTPEFTRVLEEAHQQVVRGEGTSQEELFERYGL